MKTTLALLVLLRGIIDATAATGEGGGGLRDMLRKEDTAAATVRDLTDEVEPDYWRPPIASLGLTCIDNSIRAGGGKPLTTCIGEGEAICINYNYGYFGGKWTYGIKDGKITLWDPNNQVIWEFCTEASHICIGEDHGYEKGTHSEERPFMFFYDEKTNMRVGELICDGTDGKYDENIGKSTILKAVDNSDIGMYGEYPITIIKFKKGPTNDPTDDNYLWKIVFDPTDPNPTTALPGFYEYNEHKCAWTDQCPSNQPSSLPSTTGTPSDTPSSSPTSVCTSNPCKNGGTCTADGEGGYMCACLGGYAGRDCQCFQMVGSDLTGLLDKCNALPTDPQDRRCCQGGGPFPACDSGTTGVVCPGSCNGPQACEDMTGYAAEDSCVGDGSNGESSACASMTGYASEGACRGRLSCFRRSGFASNNACTGLFACPFKSGYDANGTCTEISQCFTDLPSNITGCPDEPPKICQDFEACRSSPRPGPPDCLDAFSDFIPSFSPSVAPSSSSSPSALPSLFPSESPSTSSRPSSSLTTRERIKQYALQGGSEFDESSSYQSCALARTEEQEGIRRVSDAKLIQYYALYCIFCATNGQTNSLTSTPSDWETKTNWESDNVDPCSGWHGITCESGQVTKVALNENRLTGIWPREVILLAGGRAPGAGSLNFFDLFGNEFLSDDSDLSWISELGDNIEFLFYQATGFSASMSGSGSFVLPPTVKEFDNSYTRQTGALTDAMFENAISLDYCLMDGNRYNSSIPSAFAKLPNLSRLYVSEAGIVGDLSYMEGMPAILEHWVDSNPGLTGSIPTFIGDLSTLESFSVVECGLTGMLPTELGSLSSMTQMWFYDNNLTGSIPTEIGLLDQLELFEVQGNSLTGSMPEEVCDLRPVFGVLGTLGADCAEPSPEVMCACCSCCGDDC